MEITTGWIVEDTKKSSAPTVNETVETVETEKPKAKKTAKK